MTTTPDLPGSEVDGDDDAVFDELARRAGAALRRPAPEDGVSVIAHRRRRQQALKATVVGGIAVASLIGAVVVSTRDDPDSLRPVDSSPATLPATTTPSRTPTPTPTALGEEISVTPDFIEFGEYLVGSVGRVAKDGDRTYVLPGQIEEPPPGVDKYLVQGTGTAVLAAFDDSGRELWRTELDGGPTDVVVADGDPWVARGDGTVSRIDASDGRILDSVTLPGMPDSMVGAFGSVWVHTLERASEHMVRVDPDLSMTSVEIPSLPAGCDACPDGPAAGSGAIWVPRGDLGVAVIDADTNQVTVIPRDDIGHEVLSVAFDGDVAYVASRSQVTSIVDGEVVASVSPGGISYLGPLDGAFGVQLSNGIFQVLRADDPMVVRDRQSSTEGQSGPVSEIDGEAWMETGRNYDLRRVEFLLYSFFDGEVTTSAAYPWDLSFADVSALALNDNRDERVELVEDPLPVESGCEQGPAPTDANALAQTIRSDPDLETTAPVAVTVGGVEGVSMDIALAPGGDVCEPQGGPETGGGRWRTPLSPGSPMRLYLVDVPEGSATRMLAIAIVAPEARFEVVFEAAAPIIESIEFHPGGS
jgi:PQQ-like domain